MPAPPRPPPSDVVLRLSPERPSTREVSVSRSFSRMSQGRTSVAEYRSEARSFLDRYTPDYDGGNGRDGLVCSPGCSEHWLGRPHHGDRRAH